MHKKGQMKLVPSGHSDCSFYSVTRGETLPSRRVSGRVADTQQLSISPAGLFKVSLSTATQARWEETAAKKATHKTKRETSHFVSSNILGANVKGKR